MKLKLTTIAAVSALAAPASAADLVYGYWAPAQDYQNSVAMPDLIKMIEAETKGAIKWKLIPGGQIADGKGTFNAVKDGLMQGGLAIAVYVPNVVPSIRDAYSTVVLGDDDRRRGDARGARGDVSGLPLVPRGIQEDQRHSAERPDGVGLRAACREPVKTVEDLKGKRVRATGAAVEMVNLAGSVPVGATLTEAVSLLQRGGIDCITACPSG